MNNVEVRVRLDSTLKQEAEIVFNQMGMSVTEAIRIFLKQTVNSNSLPFRPHLKIPNNQTLASFNEINNGECESMDADAFSKFAKEL